MLENRKILTATIGYIMGIILGLYCKISIVFFYIICFIIYLFYSCFKTKNQFKIFSFKRYFRYIKLIISKNVIFIIIIFSTVSNTIVLIQNNKYEEFYKLDKSNLEIKATVVKVVNDKYKIKLEDKKQKNIYLYMYLKSNSKLELVYGDEIKLEGIYSKPKGQRNYKGFDYSKYLKAEKIYGTIKAEQVEIIKKENVNFIFKYSNKIKEYLEKLIEKIDLSDEEKSVAEGILIGNKEEISKETTDDFSKSNISYILAISGMHITYIILFANFIFEKTIGKHKSKIMTSIIILTYLYITNFAPSVVRAGIVGILVLISNFVYRKSDIYQNIGITLIILLAYNPFLILSLSLQLSFTGTIGIIFIFPNLKKFINYFIDRKEREAIRKNLKFKKYIIKISKTKIAQIILDAILVALAANIVVMPIVLLNFNVINITNFIISIISSFLIGPIILIGIIYFIVPINFIGWISKIIVSILINTSKIGASIPLNQIYFITPSIICVIIYYLAVCTIHIKIIFYYQKDCTNTQKRLKNLIQYFKFYIKQKSKKVMSIITIIVFTTVIISIIPKDLNIYFVDVRTR